MQFNLLCLLLSTLMMPVLAAKELELDDFESTMAFELKEWGDTGALSLSQDHVSHGQNALKIKFEKVNGPLHAKGIVLRRPLLGRAVDYQDFTLDIYADAASSLSVQAAVEADRTYEHKIINLQAGWNKNIQLHLDSQAFQAMDDDGVQHGLDPKLFIGSLILSIRRLDNVAGAIYIDHIRAHHRPELSLHRPKAQVITEHRIKLGSIQALPTQVEMFRPIEISLGLDAQYIDPYDPNEIELKAELTAPDGQHLTVLGFLYAGEVDLIQPVKGAIWKIRLTATQAGTWRYNIVARNRWGQSISEALTFAAVKGSHPGFVRVDKRQPNYFSFDSGQFYYPLGQNLAWLDFHKYPQYLKRMGEQKENWARLWMSSWSFGLEWKPMGAYGGLGLYNLQKADQLDQVLSQAEEHGIKVQLVFDFHGAFSSSVNSEWLNNPYNKANGGYLNQAEDFFTNPKAEQVYKKRVRYIIARWGYSPTLMAWELFNEVSYTDNYNAKAVTAWHQRLAHYMKSIDPYQHLITTSYGGDVQGAAFDLPEIDFRQNHLYASHMVGLLKNLNDKSFRRKKPFFIGEFGSNASNAVDDLDKQGVFLHAGIWSQFMQNAGGNAMPWWWDSHIDPNNLYYHFGALARFAAGLDRRDYAFESWQQKLRMKAANKDYDFELRGLINPALSMFWLSDAEGLSFQEKRRARAFEAVKIALDQFKEGSYELEYWNSYTGLMTRKLELKAEQGRLVLELPYFVNDLAFKLRRLK